MSEFFEPTLTDLQAALPQWLAVHDPNAALYKLLAALAALADGLVTVVEGIHADQALATARDEALRAEWALLWGAASEQLPTSTDLLRDYLQNRAQDDGSLLALEDTLLSLLRLPQNDAGTQLTFDSGGAGLTFPADGSGLLMFENVPEGGWLTFPADGSGLLIPADGSGVLIPPRGRVEVLEDATDSTFTVQVREVLYYDQGLFARAVARARFADMTAPTITRVP